MSPGTGSRKIRRTEGRALGAGLCNAEHPTRQLPDGSKAKMLCQRPAGHPVQHRAKTKAGYVWWS